MRVLFLKTIRDLRAARAQAIALVVIVALGVASFVGLAGAFRDLSSSYNSTYDRLHFADVTLSVQNAPASVVDEVRNVEGVSAATGRLIVDTGFRLENGDEIRSRLIGIPAGGHPAVNDVLVQEGRYLQGGREALLESHFADVYGDHPGATVTPIVGGKTVPFTVVGVAASPEYLIVSPSRQELLSSARTFAVLFVPLDELQSLTGAAGQINDVDILLAPGADRAQVVDKIQALLAPHGLLSTTLQADQASNAALRLDLEGYRELAYMMPGLILLVGAISVYVTLGRLVRSQQPQIGLMKALGYSNRAVMGHYLVFALSIGMLGAILGVLLGIPLSAATTNAYAAELGIPLVESRLYPDLIGLAIVLALVFTVIAGLGPSRGATRLSPAIAMRMDPSAALVKGRPSFLERLFRPPLWLRMPLRSVFRVRRRSLTTALGIVFAYMLVLMSWGMLDSISYLLHQNFQVIEQWDVMASFQSPQTEGVLAQVQGWQGVSAAEPAIQLPATLKVGSENQDVLLTGFSPTQQMHELQLSSGNTPEKALSPGKVVLTTALVNKLGLRVGDTVQVDTPVGQKEFTLGGVTEEMAGSAAYASLEDVRQMMGAPAPVFNALYLKVDPSQTKNVKAQLYELPGASNVQLKTDVQGDWQSYMGLFYAFMGVLLAFALAMAFALLFNAMTVNVLERQREFATMRAVGAGWRRITLMLSGESLILWVLTLIPGLVLGWLVAMQMGAAFSSDLLSFQIVIYPASYALTAIGILLTMLLAALPAIRRVNGLNLAESTKVLT
ncbi:MAG: ABC transporter permease [Chloroflexota bacterium]